MGKIPYSDELKFNKDTTLFITDLDGTLLEPDAKLPSGAHEIMRELYESGVTLTYSTARTIRSAKFILEGVPFSAPIGLMNGVLIRDMNAGKYVAGNLLDQDVSEWVTTLGGEPFVYMLDENDDLFTAYREIKNAYMDEFLSERVTKYAKPFRRVDSFETLISEGQRIIYFCFLDTRENLEPIRDAIEGRVDENGDVRAKCALYPDNYREGLYYLEVFAPTASKGAVCKKLREITGKETIVCFGDNGNDLAMFEASDYAFAPFRATDGVKQAADAVIKGGIGVLEFIRDHII